MSGSDPSRNTSINEMEYGEFCLFLQDSCGIVLGDNKQYLVQSRLMKMMKENNYNSLSGLIKDAKSSNGGKIKNKIIDAMTTNETSWFRDIYPYNALKEYVIPDIVRRKPRSIRVWSAACSSGQEPYSISISVSEYLRKNPGALSDYQVVATDISDSMLAEARYGRYEEISLKRGLDETRIRENFEKEGDLWSVRKHISERVIFKEINLLESIDALGSFDVVFCRNVLIYFSVDVKKDILDRIAGAMRPGGYLILGGSESIVNFTTRFESIKHGNGLIYRLKP